MVRRHRIAVVRVATVPIGCALLMAVAGCRVSEWEAGESEVTPSTSIPEYARDESGVRASLIAAFSNPADNFNEWSPSVAEAECVATRLLRRFGADRLLEAGYDPQAGSLVLAWSPEEQPAAVNILVGCIPFDEGLLELILGYDKVDLDVAACIGRGAERRRVPTLLAESLVVADRSNEEGAGGELARELAELSVECLGPDDLTPNAAVVPLPEDQRNDPEEDLGSGTSTTTR